MRTGPTEKVKSSMDDFDKNSAFIEILNLQAAVFRLGAAGGWRNVSSRRLVMVLWWKVWGMRFSKWFHQSHLSLSVSTVYCIGGETVVCRLESVIVVRQQQRWQQTSIRSHQIRYLFMLLFIVQHIHSMVMQINRHNKCTTHSIRADIALSVGSFVSFVSNCFGITITIKLLCYFLNWIYGNLQRRIFRVVSIVRQFWSNVTSRLDCR